MNNGNAGRRSKQKIISVIGTLDIKPSEAGGATLAIVFDH